MIAQSTYSETSVETVTHDDDGHKKRVVKAKISNRFIVASILCLFSWILLLISFASPYWLSSYSYTYSPFVRLGLWDFCFTNYRHPSYQYDERFVGCHWVYSSRFQNIRDWLQPGWFIFVQAMATIAFVLSLLSLITISIVLMYFFVREQVIVIMIAFVLQAAAVLPLLLAIIVFGAMAFDRSWLLYPTFNHLDWAYFIAIASLIFGIIASVVLLTESREARRRRKKMHNLVYNMQPRIATPNGGRAFHTPPETKPLHHQSMQRPSSVQPSVQQPYFTTV